MVTSRGVPLRITVKITDEGSVLSLIPEDKAKPPLVVKGGLNREALQQQRENLRLDLEKFKDHIESKLEVRDWNRISEAMACLHRRGRRLLHQLFENQGEIVKAHKMCREAFPTWDQDRVIPLLMEFEASVEDTVPIEYLPLFNTKPPSEISSINELAAVAHSFLGFSTIIKRIIPHIKQSSKTELFNTPKLPLKFFYFAKLNGAQTELNFFTEQSNCIDIDGPWPNSKMSPNQLVRIVADHLSNPTMRFDGAGRQPYDQIQHFSCHCYTDEKNAEEHYIELAPKGGPEYKVTIGDLQDNWGDVSNYNSQENAKDLPLVFFNACGSSVIHPAGVASFPRLILKNGNLGFIGTETVIPDTVAAAFSQQFYRYLLKGRPLGEAIYLAKWKLLMRYNNPLGILYTIYANPDIHVKAPIISASKTE